MNFLKMIISIIFCISLISCGEIHSNSTINSGGNSKNYHSEDYHPFAKETALKVIDYLDDGEVEKFKKLLSKSVLLREDVNEQLEVLFDFCKNYDISYKEISSAMGATERRDGQYTYQSIRVVIEGAIVFDEESYNIDFYYVLVDDDNERNIGLSEILIRDTDKSIMYDFFEEQPAY